VGINTSSFGRPRNSPDPAERIALADRPALLRDELGMSIIDFEPVMFKAPDLPFASEDRSAQEAALAAYRKWIDVAAHPG